MNASSKSEHGCFLKSVLGARTNGQIFGWGNQEYGALGNAESEFLEVSALHIGSGRFDVVSCGSAHTLFIRDGVLMACGRNDYGRLGDGTTTSRTIITPIDTGFTAASAGLNHSLGLKGADLYAWGSNTGGKLGDGMTTERHTPTYIGTGYTSVSAGFSASFGLKGTNLYAWGGGWGMTPTFVDSGVDKISPHPFTGPQLILKSGSVYKLTTSGQTHIGSGFTDVANGELWPCGLKGTDLYSWGISPQTETPALVGAGFSAIATGGESFALKDGNLYHWNFRPSIYEPDYQATPIIYRGVYDGIVSTRLACGFFRINGGFYNMIGEKR